jgi:hypothetical protein
MNEGDNMRSERALVNQIRGLMESSNPVPADVYQGEAPYQTEIAALLTELRFAPPEPADQPVGDPVPVTRRAPRNSRRRQTTWRVLGPVLSGLAVVAVVTSLTVAAGQVPSRLNGGPQSPAAATLPRFFATINGTLPAHPRLVVHRTSTGQAVAALPFKADTGPFGAIAAGSSDRAFYVAVNRFIDHGRIATVVVYKAQLSVRGDWTIARLPVSKRLPQSGYIVVTGIGISPDGHSLAVTLQSYITARTHTEIAVVPLNGKSVARIWSAPSVSAIALDPVWTDNHDLAFLWQDHLTGSAKFGGRSQERALDISLPGSRLLSAKVLITSDAGLMETAFASPHGGPIFAAIANDKPAKGNSGVSTVRLVWFTPHHSGFRTLAIHNAHYNGLPGRDRANVFYQVFGIDASGQHALVASPNFGMMDIHKLRPLPGVHGQITGAAW